jgi:transcriptional regulator GlxA family with amidase domain
MAAEMGGDLLLHHCAPVAHDSRTSLDVELGGLSALPPELPPNSLVIVTGNACEAEDYARPEAHAVVDWLRTRRAPTRARQHLFRRAAAGCRRAARRHRRCTTHHSLIDDLRAAAPTARVLENRVFVEDGPVLTSAGITTGIDLALYLIERHAGAELAARVARRLVVYQRRSGTTSNSPPGWRTATTCIPPCIVRRTPSRRNRRAPGRWLNSPRGRTSARDI